MRGEPGSLVSRPRAVGPREYQTRVAPRRLRTGWPTGARSRRLCFSGGCPEVGLLGVEGRGQPGEVADRLVVIGAVQLIEARARHVERSLLEHDRAGARHLARAGVEWV